jgi:hypothetical protein
MHSLSTAAWHCLARWAELGSWHPPGSGLSPRLWERGRAWPAGGRPVPPHRRRGCAAHTGGGHERMVVGAGRPCRLVRRFAGCGAVARPGSRAVFTSAGSPRSAHGGDTSWAPGATSAWAARRLEATERGRQGHMAVSRAAVPGWSVWYRLWAQAWGPGPQASGGA